jgi:8-oxo-dGTP pyrophosphatase MutT (NUDIX family)
VSTAIIVHVHTNHSEGSVLTTQAPDSRIITLSDIEAGLLTYEYRTRREAKPGRWAGVVAMLRVASKGAEVLLIRRTEHPNDPWSGHMAMPGGRAKDSDPSIQHTAERETLEEVAIDLTKTGRYLGRLDDVTAVARGRMLDLTIATCVYHVEDHVSPVANPAEVQEVVWIPLNDLTGHQYRSVLTYEHESVAIKLPCWRWNDRVIWGLTYNMLEALIHIGH